MQIEYDRQNRRKINPDEGNNDRLNTLLSAEGLAIRDVNYQRQGFLLKDDNFPNFPITGEEVKEALDKEYPDGVLIYHHPFLDFWDCLALEKTLKKALPTVCPRVISVNCLSQLKPSRYQSWPADRGIQVGDRWIGQPQELLDLLKLAGLESYIDKLPRTQHVFSDDNIFLKNFIFTPATSLIGGHLVPVISSTHGLSPVYIYGGSRALTREEQEALKTTMNLELRGARPVGKINGFWWANRELARENSSDWTFGKFSESAHHLDLLLTAIEGPDGIITYFFDKLLYDLLSRYSLIPDYINEGNIVLVPHDLTLQGGLNLGFINTPSKSVVLTGTRESLNPKLIQMLEGLNIDVVVLGSHHVANGGGPKCRSLHLKWRQGE